MVANVSTVDENRKRELNEYKSTASKNWFLILALHLSPSRKWGVHACDQRASIKSENQL